MSDPTPLVTASRDALAEVIGKHPEHYDGDCGYYNGCDCGWDNGTEDNNDGYAEHVATELLASGVVRAVDVLADDDALVEAVGLAIYGGRENYGEGYPWQIPCQTAVCGIRALATALATPSSLTTVDEWRP